MTDLHEIAEKAVEAAIYTEGFDWQDFFEVDPKDKTQVALLWHELKRLQRAVNGLVSSLDSDLGPLLQEQGSVSFGDTLIYAKQKRKEFCIDEWGFGQWLEENPELAARLFNPNDVRLGQLPKPVRDTFFEMKDLQGVATSEAPKEYLR